jgi:ketosteroid isomerase-like protein
MTIQDHNGTRSPRETLAAWLSAFNAKDIESLCALYDPQSLYANAAAPIVHGIEQIKPWYVNAFAMISGTLLFKEEALFQESTMALLIGKYYFKALTGNEETSGDTGRVALVYRLSEDGHWLLLFDMDNTPPDVTPKDFD